MTRPTQDTAAEPEVTAADLTDEEIREHLAWLVAGEYKLGEGPRAGTEKREAQRQCIAALVPDGQRVVQAWQHARERVAAAINARRMAP